MGLWSFIKRRIFVAPTVGLGRGFHLGLFSVVTAPDHLAIGEDVYVGKFCTIQCNGVIGDFVLIANHVGIVGRRDHDIRALGVPVRRAPWSGSDPRLAHDPANRIEIGDDVWIGYGATILSGIRIGRGAVIAAGAVVRSDVAAYDMVAGNPATPFGRRFDDGAIAEHERMIAERRKPRGTDGSNDGNARSRH